MRTSYGDRRALIGGMAGLAALGAFRANAAHGAAAAILTICPQCPRRGRAALADPGGYGGFRQDKPEHGVAHRLLAGAGARTAQQAEGSAGGWTGGYRSGVTGTDALSAGIDQNLSVPLVTDYAAVLPKLQGNLSAGRREMEGLTQN